MNWEKTATASRGKGIRFFKSAHLLTRLTRRWMFWQNLSFGCTYHRPLSPRRQKLLYPNLSKFLKGRRFFERFGGDSSNKSTFYLFLEEMMCQVGWSWVWTCETTCRFHGSMLLPSCSGPITFMHFLVHMLGSTYRNKGCFFWHSLHWQWFQLLINKQEQKQR